ncbi:MAG: PorV/PorQ family protein, partial [Bacteroidia bacterium]|nr:PorV/PorQ family protein [Bacteroidia bacterium]
MKKLKQDFTPVTMKIALLIVVFFLPFAYCYSQARKYSNEFLSIGVGARALAMSNAQVATVDDATSGFWNPAGLINVKGNLQLAVMHTSYFAGIANYDYGSIAIPVDATSTMGFSVIRFGVDNIPDTTELLAPDGSVNYDKVKPFSIADYAFYFSYAKKSKVEGFSYGGNAKVIHRIAGDFANAWGFGIDLGAQYKKGKWSFGVMGKDITSTFNAWSFETKKFEDVFAATGNEIPKNSLELTLPKLIPGVAYTTDISKKFSITGAIDFDVTFDG